MGDYYWQFLYPTVSPVFPYALFPNVRDDTITGTLLNDWIRPLGEPRRIIADQWSLGMTGVEWEELPRTYCIQLVYAPSQAPQQNGLVERVVRSLKYALRQLMVGPALQPSQYLLTRVAMALSSTTVARRYNAFANHPWSLNVTPQ